MLTDDQLALPVTDAGARFDDRWPAMDQHRRNDVARCAFGCFAAALAQWPTGTQLRRQRPAQLALAAEIQCLIDRFVADVPFRAVGIVRTQPGADLLRTPSFFQPVGHQLPQFGVKDQGARSLASSVVASAGMREVGVTDAFVVWL